jgi:hypothetical protein
MHVSNSVYADILSWHSVNSIPFDVTPPLRTYNANVVVICTFETGTLILGSWLRP